MPLTLRFRDFPEDQSRLAIQRLLELAYESKFVESRNPSELVEIEITGPYGGDSDLYTTPFFKRASRGILSKTSKGSHLAIPRLATGLVPSARARKNIWFTGENQRPPFGNWDAYLSFDSKFPSDRNIYFPLWLITSTDAILDLEHSYWGAKCPSIANLIKPRELNLPKKKFACAFVGKNYRMRLHALRKLNSIGRVDVFGEGARRPVESPSEIALTYKFAMCFENDLYPGYVTEKPFEAYLAGTIPLYYGIDSEGFLNSDAILNLYDYPTQSAWLERIEQLNVHPDQYSEVFCKPLLRRTPDIPNLVRSLRTLLDV